VNSRARVLPPRWCRQALSVPPPHSFTVLFLFTRRYIPALFTFLMVQVPSMCCAATEVKWMYRQSSSAQPTPPLHLHTHGRCGSFTCDVSKSCQSATTKSHFESHNEYCIPRCTSLTITRVAYASLRRIRSQLNYSLFPRQRDVVLRIGLLR
jgi:hypothetical protein